MISPHRDHWAEWMLHRRFGGDPEQQKTMLDLLYPVRDKVLRNAGLSEGGTLLDVGTGDGLIAFGALEQVGERGKVIFSDISQDLLNHSRSLAADMGVLDRCRFVLAPADDLSAIRDESVDAVTTRSVLIFVADKQRAFQEFHRVLKPGGRISFFEPINSFGYPRPPHLFWSYDVTPVIELASKVRAVYDRLQPVAGSPMLDFDEHDLIAFAEQTGFKEVHLQFYADVEPTRPEKWESAVRRSPNPLVPTLEEAMNQALTPEEAERFVAYLRPLVEAGKGEARSAVAYLWAVK